MSIIVECTCGRKLAIREDLAGQRVNCPACSAPIEVPAKEATDGKTSCPYCAAKIDAGLTVCPFCNENLARHAAAAAQASAKPPPPPPRREIRVPELPPEPPPPSETEPYVAWEDKNRGFFARCWSTWAESQFGPDAFFARMPLTGGLWEPLKYSISFVFQFLLLGAMCSLPFLLLVLAAAATEGDGAEAAGVTGAVLLIIIVVAIPAMILTIVVLTFISAAITHVCAMIVGGRGPFEATFRVICYSAGCSLWGVIPYIGALISTVFQIICHTHGLAYAHNITKGRAVLAVLLPLICCCGLGTAFLALALMSGGAREFQNF